MYYAMLTLFARKIPTESTSFFDDDIKELLYGFTKISDKTMKSAIAWKDNMSHAKGTESYSGKDFDYYFLI